MFKKYFFSLHICAVMVFTLFLGILFTSINVVNAQYINEPNDGINSAIGYHIGSGTISDFVLENLFNNMDAQVNHINYVINQDDIEIALLYTLITESVSVDDIYLIFSVEGIEEGALNSPYSWVLGESMQDFLPEIFFIDSYEGISYFILAYYIGRNGEIPQLLPFALEFILGNYSWHITETNISLSDILADHQSTFESIQIDNWAFINNFALEELEIEEPSDFLLLTKGELNIPLNGLDEGYLSNLAVLDNKLYIQISFPVAVGVSKIPVIENLIGLPLVDLYGIEFEHNSTIYSQTAFYLGSYDISELIFYITTLLYETVLEIGVSTNFSPLYAEGLAQDTQPLDEPPTVTNLAHGLLIESDLIVNNTLDILNVTSSTITNSSISFTLDSLPGQVINIGNIEVQIFPSNWMITWDRAIEPIIFNLSDTEWHASIVDGEMMIYADFSSLNLGVALNNISFIVLQSMIDEEYFDWDEWFSTLLILDEELLPMFVFDPLGGREFDTIEEMLYFMEFGEAYEIMLPFIRPLGINLHSDNLELEIISTISSAEFSDSFSSVTFIAVTSSYLNTEDLWDNVLIFAELEFNEEQEDATPLYIPEFSFRVTPVAIPRYFDYENNVMYFTIRIVDRLVNVDEDVEHNLHLLELQTGNEIVTLNPQINFDQLLANHNPIFDRDPEGDFSPERFIFSGFEEYVLEDIEDRVLFSIFWLDDADLQFGKLRTGQLEIPLGDGIYLTNIALDDHIFYFQIRHGEQVSHPWITLFRDDFEGWWPIFIGHNIIQEDGVTYVQYVYFIENPAEISSLLLDIGFSVAQNSIPIDIELDFSSPLVLNLNIFIEDEYEIYVLGEPFSVSNFRISPTIFDFSIRDSQAFSEIIENFQNANEYFEIILFFEDGTEELLDPISGGFSLGFWEEYNTLETGMIGNIWQDVLINTPNIVAFTINGVEVTVRN